MNIKYVKHPTACDINFITAKINQETLEYGQADSFAFFIKDDAGYIIAGANGFIMYGAIYTDQLWVDKNYRGRGFGCNIMHKIHDLGKSKKCTFATIQTMSFQDAQFFYKKLGYIQDFKRTGYIKNSDCILMKKIL